MGKKEKKKKRNTKFPAFVMCAHHPLNPKIYEGILSTSYSIFPYE